MNSMRRSTERPRARRNSFITPDDMHPFYVERRFYGKTRDSRQLSGCAV